MRPPWLSGLAIAFLVSLASSQLLTSNTTCPPGTVGELNGANYTCTPCEIQNCSNCSDVSTCQSCQPGYVLGLDPNSETVCLRNPCEDMTCAQCIQPPAPGPSNCSICYPGSFLLNGMCLNCTDGCLECDGSGPDQCRTWSDGYNCSEQEYGCQYCIRGLCLTCESWATGVCSPGAIADDTSDPTDPCQNCTNCTNNICYECDMGLFLLDGICQGCQEGCDQCEQSPSNCLQWNASWIGSSEPLVCSQMNCQYCKSRGQCTSCEDPLHLEGTVCTSCNLSLCASCLDGATVCDECSPGSYLADGACKPCDDGCVECDGPQMCTGWLLHDEWDLNCSQQNSNCKYCTQNGTCLGCVDGFESDDNSTCMICKHGCVCNNTDCDYCQAGFWLDASSGSCLPCPNGCMFCYDPNKCLAWNTTDGGILDCRANPACIYCNSNGSCQQCENGFLEGDTCTKQDDMCDPECSCPHGNSSCEFLQLGQYVVNGEVSSCDSGCLKCNGSGNCSEWDEVDGTGGRPGIKCSLDIPNCTYCLSSGLCNVCDDGFVLTSDGNCILQCDEGCVCGIGNPACNSCEPGYYFFQDTCMGCQEGCAECEAYDSCFAWETSIGAKDCSFFIGEGCRSCSKSGCESCEPGYEAFEDACRISGSNCPLGCDECDSQGNCLECQRGYGKNATGTCYRCEPDCLSCDDFGKCREWWDQSSFSNYTNCAELTPNCDTCDQNGSCSSCLGGYDLDALGNCVQDCLENCFCHFTKCDQCMPNFYFVDTQSSCLACATGCTRCDSEDPNTCLEWNITGHGVLNCAQVIPGCEYCSNNATCVNCSQGSTLENGTCQPDNPVSTYCQENCECDDEFARCSRCAPGSYLADNGNCTQCEEGCASCNSTGYCQTWVNSDIGFFNCEEISGCQICSQDLRCFGCQEGFAWNETTQACESNCGENCICNDPQAYCQGCAPGFFLKSDGSGCTPCEDGCLECGNQTSSCMLWGFLPNVTLSCEVNGCKYCSRTGVCQECADYYIFNSTDNTCTLNCKENCNCNGTNDCSSCISPGYYYSADWWNPTCQKCAPGCAECLDGYSCTRWLTGNDTDYFCDSLEGCLACDSLGCTLCRDNYFAYEGTCQKCSLGCTNCTSPTDCVSCDASFNLTNGVCQNDCGFDCRFCYNGACLSCADGTYWDIFSGSCTPCAEGCHFCETPNRCYAWEGDQGQRDLCSDLIGNCKFCTNNGTCTECWDGYTQDPNTGMCIAIEPDCSSNQGCQVCNPDLTCNDCLDNFIEIDGNCFPIPANYSCNQGCACYSGNSSCDHCLLSFYSDGENCQPCDPGCLLCNGTGMCLLWEQDGSYTGKCTDVDPNCLFCGSDGNCTECNPGYNATNGTCTSTCQDGCSCGNSTCDYCLSGYFNSSGVCTPCDGSCSICDDFGECYAWQTATGARYCSWYVDGCSTCAENTSCLSCFDGWEVVNGTCQSSFSGCQENCICYYASSTCDGCLDSFFGTTDGQCEACDPGCANCDGIGMCTAWFNYDLGVQSQCWDIENCKYCNNNSRCVECVDGSLPDYFGSCVIDNSNCPSNCICSDGFTCTSCAPGSYNSSSGDCIPCQDGCSQCTTNGSCTVWNSTEFGTLTCSEINPNCQSCNADSTCNQCYGSYVVSAGLCVSMCSGGQSYCQDGCVCDGWQTSCDYCQISYFKTANGCQACDDNCTICEGPGACQFWWTSPGGYFNCSVIPGCVSCLENGTCVGCEEGWMMDSTTGTCIEVCQPNCLCSSLNSSCDSCEAGFFNQNGSCQPCDDNCNQCDGIGECILWNAGNFETSYCPIIPGCRYCSKDFSCTECWGGFSLTNGQCEKNCDPNCECYYGTCDSCLSSFFMQPDQGQCEACEPGCSSCNSSSICREWLTGNGSSFDCGLLPGCQACQVNGTCTLCDDGHYLDGSDCKPCQYGCLNCTSFDTCQTCDSWNGYTMDVNGNCNNGCPQNCSSCNQSVNVCDMCYEGNFIDWDGSCSPCTNYCVDCEGSSSNCTQWDSPIGAFKCSDIQGCVSCDIFGNCLTCQPGYTNYQGQCYFSPCSPNCIACGNNDPYWGIGTCMRCAPSFLSVDGNCEPCVEGCLECIGEVNQCIRWSADNGSLSCLAQNCFCDRQGECSTCFYGYESIGGQCVVNCSDNCQECTIPNTCTNCTDGHRLFNDGCALCPDTCSDCSSDNTCSACIDGYFLNDTNCSQCVEGCDRCDNSTWETCRQWTGNSSCNQISPGCEYCDTGSNCFRCLPGYTLSPDGASCQECATGCLNCADPSPHTCSLWGWLSIKPDGTIDSPPYIWANAENINGCKYTDWDSNCITCLDGFWSDGVNCQPCNSSCVTCQGGPNNCTSCTSDKILSAGLCLKCPANCLLCNSNGYCLECMEKNFANALGNCSPCFTGLVNNLRTPLLNGLRSNITISTCLECDSQAANVCKAWNISTNVTTLASVVTTTETQVICNSTTVGAKYCTSAGVALGCSLGYFYNISQRTCTPCSNGCNNCTLAVTCSLCNPGFFQTRPNALCHSCADGCLECNGNATNQCREWNVAGGEALVCNSSTGCYFCDQTGACLSCSAGFFLQNGSCSPCSEYCDVCKTNTICSQCSKGALSIYGKCFSPCDWKCGTCNQETNLCTECNAGFFLDEGVCKACPDNCTNCQSRSQCQAWGSALCSDSDPNCLYCWIGGNCSRCLDGYGIGSDGNCAPCPDPFALTCMQGFSGECLENYVLSNGVCQPNPNITSCDSNCSSCDLTNAICRRCKVGFYLNTTTSECTSCLTPTNSWSLPASFSCVDCDQPYLCKAWINNTDGTLLPCANISGLGEGCEYCEMTSFNSECSVCLPGYYRDNLYHCQPCSTGCSSCKSQSICTSCQPMYNLVKNSSQMSYCSKWDCSSTCQSCDYVNRVCQQCPPGLYPGTDGGCLPCFAGCWNCDGPYEENCGDYSYYSE